MSNKVLENTDSILSFYLYACIYTHSLLPVKKKQDTETEICYI